MIPRILILDVESVVRLFLSSGNSLVHLSIDEDLLRKSIGNYKPVIITSPRYNATIIAYAFSDYVFNHTPVIDSELLQCDSVVAFQRAEAIWDSLEGSVAHSYGAALMLAEP